MCTSRQILKVLGNYSVGTYVLSNTALYVTATVAGIESMLGFIFSQKTAVNDSAYAITGLLALTLLISNGKSYYKVMQAYLENPTATNDHTEESKCRQYCRSCCSYNNLLAWGGAVMKTIASSVSWWFFAQKVLSIFAKNNPAAIAATVTMLLFLPGNIFTQIAFLSLDNDDEEDAASAPAPDVQPQWHAPDYGAVKGGTDGDLEAGNGTNGKRVSFHVQDPVQPAQSSTETLKSLRRSLLG